jgi:glycosyltransferase involved in cell wall biosynthesis
MNIGLLTGGVDRPYAFGLATTLASQGVGLEVIGSDEVDRPEFHATPGLRFLNLRGSQRYDANLATKVRRVLLYYARLIRYAAVARPKVLHILWNNKFDYFDRTLLLLYYKLQRKKIVLTAHNVNAGTRDANDSFLNRFTLKMQYRLADHIFVHTERMKTDLVQGFGVDPRNATVIPFGINNSVPDTALTRAGAKERLGVEHAKTILFFGRIGTYKGLEYLVEAFGRLATRDEDYRLIVAGELSPGCEKYFEDIQQSITSDAVRDRIVLKIGYVPDEETELYFKAADLLVLPYTQVYQSGVLFLGYNFGLPAVATDVGSLREDIVEGKTGFISRPRDPVDLARTIEKYFASDLFSDLTGRRAEIREYARARHSWDVVGEMTRLVYAKLVGHKESQSR